MKGCLARLMLLPVMVAAMYVLLSLGESWPTFAFPAKGAEVAGPVAGFFLWFAVLFLLDARRADADRRLARRAVERGRPGRREARRLGYARGRGAAAEGAVRRRGVRRLPLPDHASHSADERAADRRPRVRVGAAVCAALSLAVVAVYLVFVQGVS